MIMLKNVVIAEVRRSRETERTRLTLDIKGNDLVTLVDT